MRIATAVPDKNDTVKVVLQCRTPVRASKRDPSEMGYTHVENAGGLKDT